MRDYRRAGVLVRSVTEQMERLAATDGSPSSLHALSSSLERSGDIELAEGRRSEALVFYLRSLEIRERIVREFGDTPESLRDVGASCYRLALCEEGLGNPADAIGWLQRARALTQRIIDTGWATPQNYEDLETIEAFLGRLREGA